MCLNQTQGPKLDENCLDHGSHIANQLVTIAVLHVYSPHAMATQVPRLLHVGRYNERELATWPI